MQRRLHSTNHSPTYYTTETNDTATPTTTATKSYIKAYLRTSRASYNPSISASPTNPSLHYVSCLQTPVKDEHEPRNIQGAVYKINCSDCRNVSNYCQQQSFSRLHPPRRSNYTVALGFFFNRRATFPPVKKKIKKRLVEFKPIFLDFRREFTLISFYHGYDISRYQ